jgi:XTP/dITP diphosphohydrolase
MEFMLILVATNNRGKLEELRDLLPEGATLISLQDAGIESPEETGSTFEENALLKARAAHIAGRAALADDSGLEVCALNNAPGVRSARYAGLGASDELNNRLLLEQMLNVPEGERRARFVSVVAFITPDGREMTSTGEVHGRILRTPRGTNGFGYDPLFEIHDAAAPEFDGRTMAELSVAEKNLVSHRSRAYRQLAASIVAEISAWKSQ